MDDQNEPLLTPREKAFLAKNPEVELVKNASRTNQVHAEVATKQEDTEQPRGIAGWLLVLVIFLILGTIQRASSASLSIQAAEEANRALLGSSEWQSITTKIWTIVWVDAAVSFFAVYRLVRHRTANTVPMVIACLWLIGPVRSLVSLIVAGEQGDYTRFILMASVMPAVWTAYLLKSVRVKNTYVAEPGP